MNNEDIRKARKKYSKLAKDKHDLLEQKKELQELIETDTVKRYLELKENAGTTPLSDQAIIRYSFLETNTSKIPLEDKVFVYCGAYKYDLSYDSRSDTLLKDSDLEYADYLLYINIDNDSDDLSIDPKLQDKFEQQHTVLKFSNTMNIRRKYYELQQYYFEQLLSVDLRQKNNVLTLLKEKIKL